MRRDAAMKRFVIRCYKSTDFYLYFRERFLKTFVSQTFIFHISCFHFGSRSLRTSFKV